MLGGMGCEKVSGVVADRASLASEYADEFKALTPLGRLGTPEDLAKAAVFLASDESRWITGDILKASGGMI